MTDEGGYRVELEQFCGPMDLLLHLLREEELEVDSIPVARICDRYLVHLEELERIDIDAAGDFLVMAATLMRLKSRSLLPKEEQVASDREVIKKIAQIAYREMFDLLSQKRGQLSKMLPP